MYFYTFHTFLSTPYLYLHVKLYSFSIRRLLQKYMQTRILTQFMHRKLIFFFFLCVFVCGLYGCMWTHEALKLYMHICACMYKNWVGKLAQTIFWFVLDTFPDLWLYILLLKTMFKFKSSLIIFFPSLLLPQL